MAKIKEIYNAHLVQIDEMTPTVRNFHFEFPEKPRFDYRPGQFVMVEVPREGKNVRKPYSIASPPDWPGKIELCIKKVEGGYVSSYFFDLKPGYIMPMEGPLGVFKLKDPLPEHLIFVATGTGIAPLRAMIHPLLKNGHAGKITLILGVRERQSEQHARDRRLQQDRRDAEGHHRERDPGHRRVDQPHRPEAEHHPD
ncbi:MAG: FAD-dependent oxidoreductase, partial [Deltaproteobacteria bacterium]|nr:FAD-dependent oxidoreductase [Deltaproteobacteria bacterium]